MKRIQYHHYGGPEELRLEEAKQPDPERGQIRVRVRAAAANPMDWKIRRGEMRMLSGFRFPRGLGHDFAGVVEAVGPGVERLKAGDEVLGVTSINKAGAFAEFLVADEKNAALKPSSISFEQAAALTLVSVTAWNALVAKAKLRAGQSVFIIGCLGGVGRSAVQIARMLGADVAGSCSASGREEALALGVGEVVDYRAFNIAPYRHRFDVVFDTGCAVAEPVRRDAETPRHVAAHRPHARQVDRLPAPVATSPSVRQSDTRMHGGHRRSGRARQARPGDRPHSAAVRGDLGHRRT
jgi:NADPH:quinone reductase-like Zn-dependent oxidoreductase